MLPPPHCNRSGPLIVSPASRSLDELSLAREFRTGGIVMDQQRLIQTLDAIRDLAVRLLSHKNPVEVLAGVRHINRMARKRLAEPQPENKYVYDVPYETSDGRTYRILVYSENGKFIGRPYHPLCLRYGGYTQPPLDSPEEAAKATIKLIDPPVWCDCARI